MQRLKCQDMLSYKTLSVEVGSFDKFTLQSMGYNTDKPLAQGLPITVLRCFL